MTDVYSLQLRQAAQAGVQVDQVPIDGLVLTLRPVNGASATDLGNAEEIVLALGALWIGPPGPQGPPGLPGLAGAGYVFEQASPAAEWVVAHNLGFKPNVQVMSTGGAVIEAEVLHVDDNLFRVYFSAPFAGFARSI